MTANAFRLSRAVTPSHYELTLEPDLAAHTFRGEVEVVLQVHESVGELVANAIELGIEHAEVDGVQVSVTLDESTERVTFYLGADLAPGTQARLRVRFNGTLNDKLRGFYRSTFVDPDGVSRTIATTQFQATDCRRAFPCWDEPDFKATFHTTLVVEPDLMAISNSPEVARRIVGDKVAVEFATTMKMSTYLVAFVVGPLEATDAVDVSGTPMRIIHVPGKSHLTAFGLEIGAFALQWFQDYYGLPYPGDKVDLVALPDFGAGAMENLGCITFRENLLLVDPATATPTEEQLVADVVAHELAHMWFGDLVTMRWWNGIWLNEAFATFMEVAACDAFRPDWERWTAFSLAKTAALEVDALAATRPVEFEVVSPQDAEGMFDVLTYEKGGALLRMLEQHLGVTAFRDGVRLYLQRHAYGNTETSDLWDALEAATGEPVRRLMDSWIWQAGYPVLDLDRRDGGVVATQRRFRFDGNDDPTIWTIPLGLRELSTPPVALRVLLEGDSVVVPSTSRAPMLGNSNQNGFYRVNYSPADLTAILTEHLDALSPIERYGLVDDAWASVVAGHLGADTFCSAIEGLRSDRNLPVWQVIAASLSWCDRFVDGATRETFRHFVRDLAGPAQLDVGWIPIDGEGDLRVELRGVLIRLVALTGNDAGAQRVAREYHERWLQDPASVDPSVVTAALSIVAATGSETDYDACRERYREAASPQGKLRELNVLPLFPDHEQMLSTLQFTVTDEVRTQNAPFTIGRAITHREHGAVAWRFVRDNWHELNERFPNNTIVRMVDGVKSLTRPEQQADVQAFFGEHDIPQATKTLAQVLERQRVNTALHERAAAALAARFG